jgi:putative salt-induced outer membrane protein
MLSNNNMEFYMSTKILAFASTSALLVLSLGTAQAQPAPKPDGLWHGAAGLGLSYATGNTSSNALSINGDMSRETEVDKITGYGLVLRSQAKIAGATTKTADQMKFGGRYDRILSGNLFAFGGGELERNQLSNLDMRTSLNAGVGYKVLRNATTTFDVFAGLGWSRYDYKAPSGDKSGMEALIGEESTHKLSPTVNFKQRLVVYPGLKSDLGVRAAFDAGLSAAISGNLTANVTLSNRYQSKAGVGTKATDTLLLVGVGYKF